MAQDPYQGGVAADPDGRLTGTPAERSAREELRRRQETMVRVVLRPIGSPLALGFVALAAATLSWLAASAQTDHPASANRNAAANPLGPPADQPPEAGKELVDQLSMATGLSSMPRS